MERGTYIAMHQRLKQNDMITSKSMCSNSSSELDYSHKCHTFTPFRICCGACERVGRGKIALCHTSRCLRTYHRAYSCVADPRKCAFYHFG